MRFNHEGRVSEGWALWSSLRRTGDPAPTLREGSFARRVKAAVGSCVQSRAGRFVAGVFTPVDWNSVLVATLVVCSVVSGVLLGVMIQALQPGVVCR